MPRLFSTYTSYLPLYSGVAWRIVSVVVVLPISKNTLGGKKGRAGPGVSLRGFPPGYRTPFFAAQVPAPFPLPPVSGPPPPAPPKLPPQVLSLCTSPPSPVVFLSSPFLAQPTLGAGSPRISAISVTLAPLHALVLSGPF